MNARARSLLTLLALAGLGAGAWILHREQGASPPAPPPSTSGAAPLPPPPGLAPAPRAIAAPSAGPSTVDEHAGEPAAPVDPSTPAQIVVHVHVPAGVSPSAVQVRVIDGEGRIHEGSLMTQVSATEGAVRVADLPAGWAQVLAEAAELVRAKPAYVELEPGSIRTVHCELVAGVRLEGRVVAVGTGEPIANAFVQAEWGGAVFGEAPAPYGRVTTDANGRFLTVPVPPACELMLVAWARGYRPERDGPARPTPGGRLRTLRLQPGGAVRGVVTAPDGMPRAGAYVEVGVLGPAAGDGDRLPSGSPTRTPSWSAESDRHGHFEILDLPFGATLRVVASDDLFAPSAAQPELVLSAGSPDAEITLPLRPGATAEIGLKDAVGRPVSGAIARVGRDPEERSAESDRDGIVRLQGLAPRRALLRVSIAGFVPVEEEIQLTEGQTLRRELVLDRGLAIAGRVLSDAGAPIPGARLSVRREDGRACSAASQEAGSRGEFRFDGLEPGTHRIGVEEKGFYLPERVVDGLPIDDLRLVMGRQGTLKARFTDSRGRPPAPLTGLHAFNIDADEAFEGEIGDDGEATWTLVPGPWRLSLRAPDCQPWERVVAVYGSEPIDLGDIVLQEGRSIEGLVVDPEGAPVTDASIVASLGDVTCFSKTDPDGRFHLASLPMGEVRVRFRTRDFAERELVIDPLRAPGPLRVVLERGALVEATLRFPLDVALPESVRIDLTVLSEGSRAFHGVSETLAPSDLFAWRVPPGRYALELLLADKVVWRTELTLEDGKDVAVEIPLPSP